jgi:hypothetical protein
MTFTVVSSGCLDRNKLDALAAKSAVPDKQQLSLGLWTDECGDAAGVSRWQDLSTLEREAESALFDWTESRDAPHAPALWRNFAHKSELLAQALARRLQSNPLRRDDND